MHRDLAARNVLVDGTDTVKIADFGLSRNVAADGQEYYQLNNSETMLPFRWVPPENLLGGVSRYTQASDVWSYGVLCTEVWGLGATPYGELGMIEVIRHVQDGHVLPRADLCPAEFYSLVIAPCFERDPETRPSFDAICAEFANVESSYRRASSINAVEALFGSDGFTGTKSAVNSPDKQYLQIADQDGEFTAFDEVDEMTSGQGSGDHSHASLSGQRYRADDTGSGSVFSTTSDHPYAINSGTDSLSFLLVV